MFVVIEGIEGSGKSTLHKGLVERFGVEGREVVATREPGGTATGDAIRSIFLDRTLTIGVLTEALLVNAARAQHVAEVIRPALAENRLVLCDRFTDSTLAYQGYGGGLELASLQRLCDEATQERSYVLDRVESQDAAFHERVRRGYLELAKSARHQVLDGTLPRDGLLEDAWNFISTS